MKTKTSQTADQSRSTRTPRRLAAIAAALTITAAVSGCGSDSGDSSATSGALTSVVATNASASAADTAATQAAGTSQDTGQETGQAPGAGGQQGGPGAFGKNVDATQITTVEDVNALINEAYGDGSLDLHRGHQPVEQVLIDTLGISHDEMHVRMEQQNQNLSAVAEDTGVGTQTLIDALVANWQPAIDNIEAEGLIDADQAAQYHEALVEAFTFKVTWNGTDEAPTFTGV